MNAEVGRALKPFINEDGSVMLYGERFYPPEDNFYELAGFLLELVVFDQYQASKYIKDGMVVIDAGANIGSFSVSVAHLAPKAIVYAFEPVTTTFEILKKNTAPYPNVRCCPLGLGDVPARKKIFVYRGSTGGSTLEDSGMMDLRGSHSRELREETVTITTIDAVVRERKIPKVDFLKIDTEGYEIPILKGAHHTLQTWKPVIAVSAYHKTSDKTEIPELVQFIEGSYVYTLANKYEEDFIFIAPRSV